MINPVTEGKREARTLRKRLKLSPIQRIDPGAIAKALGVVAVGRPLRSRYVSGAYLRRKGADRSFILFNTSESVTRQRFTICHELGHFIFDKEQSIVERIQNSGTDSTHTERRANAFASELLLPEAGVRAFKALNPWESSPEQVAELALAYGTSFIATLWALCNAGALAKECVERLKDEDRRLAPQTRKSLEQRGFESFLVPPEFEALLMKAKASKTISNRRFLELRRLVDEPLNR